MKRRVYHVPIFAKRIPPHVKSLLLRADELVPERKKMNFFRLRFIDAIAFMYETETFTYLIVEVEDGYVLDHRALRMGDVERYAKSKRRLSEISEEELKEYVEPEVLAKDYEIIETRELKASDVIKTVEEYFGEIERRFGRRGVRAALIGIKFGVFEVLPRAVLYAMKEERFD